MRRSYDQGKGKCDGVLSEADQQKKCDARAKNQKRLEGQIRRPKKLLNADELKEAKIIASVLVNTSIKKFITQKRRVDEWLKKRASLYSAEKLARNAELAQDQRQLRRQEEAPVTSG